MSKIKKYIKLPVEVSAVKIIEENLDFLIKWANFSIEVNGYFINTLEGKMQAYIGDYIIQGIDGEFYPCREDIFKKTYRESVYFGKPGLIKLEDHRNKK